MSTILAPAVTSIAQPLLDLDAKERSNVFPWRGQFSPELVEILLKVHAKDGDVIFDPFAGVGTTLLEAAKLGMRSRGTELNPSAFLMAQSVEWVRYSVAQREEYIREAHEILETAMSEFMGSDLFKETGSQTRAQVLAAIILREELSLELKHILGNTLMRAMGNDFNFPKAFLQHCQILRSLPVLSTSHRIFHADARNAPLAPGSVDLVLTSPPYINVFNYHENNRPAMELLGWDILSVARAELGSNRKNRGNRFLTVIQYCLDMQMVLLEVKRVLKHTGRAIFIVGRESMVRGIPFENGELVASLAAISGFRVSLKQDRRFLNRFGQSIVEDILYLEQSAENYEQDPRRVALEMLDRKKSLHASDAVKHDMESAIKLASTVQPSPLYCS